MAGLFYFLFTLLATTLGALTGMGGGVIIKPVLDFAGSLDIGSISALSSVTVLVMSMVTLLRQRQSPHMPDLATAVPVAVGSVLGGMSGSWLLSGLINKSGANPTKVTIIQNVILAVLIVLVFLYMQKKSRIAGLHLKGWLPVTVTGIFLGLVSSFLGIGGGPINVAIIILLFSMPIKTAALCSLLTILFSQSAKIISIALTTGFAYYNLSALPQMAAGGVAGGLLGAAVYKRIASRTTGRLFNGVQVIILGLCLINIFRNL